MSSSATRFLHPHLTVLFIKVSYLPPLSSHSLQPDQYPWYRHPCNPSSTLSPAVQSSSAWTPNSLAECRGIIMRAFHPDISTHRNHQNINAYIYVYIKSLPYHWYHYPCISLHTGTPGAMKSSRSRLDMYPALSCPCLSNLPTHVLYKWRSRTTAHPHTTVDISQTAQNKLESRVRARVLECSGFNFVLDWVIAT